MFVVAVVAETLVVLVVVTAAFAGLIPAGEAVPAPAVLAPTAPGVPEVGVAAGQSHSPRISIDDAVDNLVNVFERQFALRRFVLTGKSGFVIRRKRGVWTTLIRETDEIIVPRVLFEVGFQLD